MDMKRDYYEDIQLLDSKVLWFWFLHLKTMIGQGVGDGQSQIVKEMGHSGVNA